MTDAKDLFPLVLKQLRGSLTQKQLAQKVGCSEISLSRWESGRRVCSWGTFLSICDACGKDFAMCLHQVTGYRDAIADVKMLLHRSTTGMSLPELAQKTGKPVATLHRWLEGKTEPDVVHIFMMLDVLFSGFFWGIIWNLFPRSRASMWGSEYVLYRDFMNLRLKFPYLTTLLKFMSIHGVDAPHVNQFLSLACQTLKVKKSEIEKCLKQCFRLKLLPFHHPQSRYHQSVMSFLSPHFMIKNKELAFHNMLIARHIAPQQDMMHNKSGNFYAVAEVSESARKQIADLRMTFMNQCREVLQADKESKKELFLLLNVNAFYFDVDVEKTTP